MVEARMLPAIEYAVHCWETVLAIDPGTNHSGYVVLYSPEVNNRERLPEVSRTGNEIPNDDILEVIADSGYDRVAIEWPMNMGMRALGQDIFETCYWCGRFASAAVDIGVPVVRITRNQVKMGLCRMTAGITDSVICTRIKDIYGGRRAGVGVKDAPGPLYGVKGHAWQACAVGLAYLGCTTEERRKNFRDTV